MVQTPKGGIQSHSGIPSSLPKVGTGISSPRSKGKQGKIQTVRTVTPIGNIKPNTQQTSTSMKPSTPSPQSEPSNASPKVSSASKSIRNCASQSPEVHGNMSPKANGESHLKAEEAGFGGIDGVKHDPYSGLSSEKNGSQGVLKTEMSLETKGATLLQDIEITPLKDGCKHAYDSADVELSTTVRIPFAVNNSLCNRDFPTGLKLEKADDTSLFVDSTLTENS